MKNRKQRNLDFIRRKNALRLGRNKYSGFFKISDLIELNTDHVAELINEIECNLFREFKIIAGNYVNLNTEISTGKYSEDFLKGLFTLKIDVRLC